MGQSLLAKNIGWIGVKALLYMEPHHVFTTYQVVVSGKWVSMGGMAPSLPSSDFLLLGAYCSDSKLFSLEIIVQP